MRLGRPSGRVSRDLMEVFIKLTIQVQHPGSHCWTYLPLQIPHRNLKSISPAQPFPTHSPHRLPPSRLISIGATTRAVHHLYPPKVHLALHHLTHSPAQAPRPSPANLASSPTEHLAHIKLSTQKHRGKSSPASSRQTSWIPSSDATFPPRTSSGHFYTSRRSCRITPIHNNGANLDSHVSSYPSAPFLLDMSTIRECEQILRIQVRPVNGISSCLNGYEIYPVRIDRHYTLSKRHSWRRYMLLGWAI